RRRFLVGLATSEGGEKGTQGCDEKCPGRAHKSRLVAWGRNPCHMESEKGELVSDETERPRRVPGQVNDARHRAPAGEGTGQLARRVRMLTAMSSAFRSVPRTGVIYVSTEAARRGYHAEHPDWCNLGQGQPETGPLEGAPERMR